VIVLHFGGHFWDVVQDCSIKLNYEITLIQLRKFSLNKNKEVPYFVSGLKRLLFCGLHTALNQLCFSAKLTNPFMTSYILYLKKGM